MSKSPPPALGWDMKVAPDAPAKNHKDYKIVGTSVPRVDLPAKFTGEFVYSAGRALCPACCTAAWCARPL